MSEGDPKKKVPSPKELAQMLPSGPVSEATLIALCENAARQRWKSLSDLLTLSREDLARIKSLSPKAIDEIERAKERLRRGEKNWDYKGSKAQITVGGKTHDVLKITSRGKDLGFAPIVGWFANEALAEGLTEKSIWQPNFFEMMGKDPKIKGAAQALEILQANLDVYGALFGSCKQIELEKSVVYTFKDKNNHTGQRPRIKHM